MFKCKNCGRSWLLHSINRYGLCKECTQTIELVVRSHGRVIQDCMRLVEESKNTKIKLSRCDLLIERASILQDEYEKKGIKTIDPTPSDLIQEYSAMRDQIISDGLESEFNIALAKVGTAITLKSKINTLSKLLMKLQELRPKAQNSELLNPLERRIKKKIHQTQLDGYMDAAKKAEFKGRSKKALDKYYEALYFLRTDEIDDFLQENNILYIETKIKELGGNIPE